MHFRFNPEHKAARGGQRGLWVQLGCWGYAGRIERWEGAGGPPLYDDVTGELVHDFAHPNEPSDRQGRAWWAGNQLEYHRHQAPREHELRAVPGEERKLATGWSWKLLADAGLVGHPECREVDAGIVVFGVEVGRAVNYAFTTLEPNPAWCP